MYDLEEEEPPPPYSPGTHPDASFLSNNGANQRLQQDHDPDSNHTFDSIEKHIADVALPPEFEMLRDPKEAIAYIPLLSTLPLEKEILDQIVEVYRKAMAADFYFMVATAAIGFITSFFLVDVTLEKEEFGRQGLQS